jgi:predicted dehydrogenase
MIEIFADGPVSAVTRRPRIGFLGVGRIGLRRIEAMLEAGAIDAVGLADDVDAAAKAALALAPAAARASDLAALLDLDLDGLVIATPSALHAEQAIAALDAGVAVFCQKPLGRNAAEARAVVEAARRADRLLGVDFSYRFTDGVRAMRQLIEAGALGRVFAVDLTFHNAYGPDKPWFYDPALAGGGCVIDLGVHLVDLALWLLGYPKVAEVSSTLLAKGRPLRMGEVEDYAAASLTLDDGVSVRLACSWHLQAGRDALISADFYGDGGGASFHNLEGSFFDFASDRFLGTTTERLTVETGEWGGRAAIDWARRLGRGQRFDRDSEHLVEVAEVLDRIYDSTGGGARPTPAPA